MVFNNFLDNETIEILLIIFGSILGLLLVVYFIFFLMLLPGRKSKKLMKFDWLFEKPIAHRGYHKGNQEVPENSKIAFQRAIDKGYNIEIDLNITKDNRVVVIHDGTLDRMCGTKNVRIRDLTLAEVKQYRLMGGEQEIMELQEFLDFVDDRAGLLIEMKDSFDGELEKAALPILRAYKGRYVMQAFSPFSLKWFKKNAPEIPRGQLCFNYMSNKGMKWHRRFLYTYLFSNFIGRPHFISYCWPGAEQYTNRLLRKMGAKLLVWTVVNEDIYNKVKDHCDNVIFENLDL